MRGWDTRRVEVTASWTGLESRLVPLPADFGSSWSPVSVHRDHSFGRIMIAGLGRSWSPLWWVRAGRPLRARPTACDAIAAHVRHPNRRDGWGRVHDPRRGERSPTHIIALEQ